MYSASRPRSHSNTRPSISSLREGSDEGWRKGWSSSSQPECRACCKRCGRDEHGGRDFARIENGLRMRQIVGVPVVERHGDQSEPVPAFGIRLTSSWRLTTSKWRDRCAIWSANRSSVTDKQLRIRRRSGDPVIEQNESNGTGARPEPPHLGADSGQAGHVRVVMIISRLPGRIAGAHQRRITQRTYLCRRRQSRLEE